MFPLAQATHNPTSYTVCWQLATIQHTRLPGAPWVGQTDDIIYDFTIARHQTLRYVPIHSAIYIGCLVYIRQSSKTNINSVLSRSNQTLVIVHRDHPARAYHMHAMTACRQFDHRLIIRYGNSKISYQLIQVSHP